MAAALEVPNEAPEGTREIGAPLVLVRFPEPWARHPNPFVLALETWLRLAELPFTVENSLRGEWLPDARLPRLRDGARLIVGLDAILDHLKASRGIDPDAALAPHQQAEAKALRRLLEDHLYFAILWARWFDPDAEARYDREVVAPFHPLLRPIARSLLRLRVGRLLDLHGLGRMHADAILALARDDLDALSRYLGDKPFFMGEQLTTLDAIVYGFLANVYYLPIGARLKKLAYDFPNLVSFCETMEAGVYGEDRASL
ncbi:MAG: glutathione S-transferase family protein [Geminicoccaceae bacterium]|nr:glutathione S-transferase family protein [Geminicoccaceae bacterium]